jgi:hypothetical protein
MGAVAVGRSFSIGGDWRRDHPRPGRSQGEPAPTRWPTPIHLARPPPGVTAALEAAEALQRVADIRAPGVRREPGARAPAAAGPSRPAGSPWAARRHRGCGPRSGSRARGPGAGFTVASVRRSNSALRWHDEQAGADHDAADEGSGRLCRQPPIEGLCSGSRRQPAGLSPGCSRRGPQAWAVCSDGYR